MAIPKKKYVIYTDGSANPNPGLGGYGIVIISNDDLIYSASYPGGKNTTNNRMELEAVIKAYSFISNENNYTIMTDSKYVQQGLTEWCSNWIKNNWKTAHNKPVLNKDLWLTLLEHKNKFPNVSIKWIKAHSGNKWNDMVDELAKKGCSDN
jgi:ribonuclease HI